MRKIMKRRSFLSIALAALIPTSLISTEPIKASGTVKITVDIEDEYAPYLVSETIKNEKTGKVTTINETVFGRFVKVLSYRQGQNFTLDVTVTAARAGSPNGYLSIGENVAKLNGDQRVMICNFKPVA